MSLKRRLHPRSQSEPGRSLINGQWYWMLSGNDYLGLAHDSKRLQSAIQSSSGAPFGSMGSRLLGGDHDRFSLLEASLAEWIGTEAAVVFNSGYHANVGVITSLVAKGDVVFMDRLCHASMVDGVRLSGADFFRFRHNDIEHLKHLLDRYRHRYRHALILTESVFSMDGDIAPIESICKIKTDVNARLLVDESHGIGMFGVHGKGIVSSVNKISEVDVLLASFGKAFGSYGAFIAGSSELKDQLINQARPFIYSTALPYPVVEWNLSVVLDAKSAFSSATSIHSLANELREGLIKSGYGVLGSTHIVPVVLGDSQTTLDKANELKAKGFWATAIRPPTVPKGKSRIRFSIIHGHTSEMIRQLISVM